MVIAKQSHAVTCKCVCQSLSRVRLFATTWTVARQASLSMGFSRQEYWSGLPCPPPGDLPDPGIELKSLLSPALSGRFFTTSGIWEAHSYMHIYILYNIIIYTQLSLGIHRTTPFPQQKPKSKDAQVFYIKWDSVCI